jgi:hypothetical protein
MKKKLQLAVLLAVAAPALWLGFGGSPNWADRNQDFGQKLAGGWVVTIDIGQPADVLMTLAADGGVIFSGQLRSAGPDNTGAWMGTRYNTTAHGSWRRIMPNKIELVVLLQVQDNDGGLVFYEKVAMQMALDKTRTTMEGTGGFQLFEAGIDPLDPNAPVFVEGPFTETARLIR